MVGAGGVMVLAVMLVAGGYANGLLRAGGQRVLSWQLDEVCLIDEIQGNPLGDCRVVGVQVGDWARVDTLDVAYSFWGLIWGKALVHRLRLSGIEVRIDASGESAEPTEWGTPPVLDLDIESLEIVDADVVVDGTPVRDIALKGAVSVGESECRLTLARFRSVQFDPPLEVTNLSGIAVLQAGDLALDDVALHTPNSRVLLRGTVRQLDDPELDLVVEADSLWLADIRGLGEMPARAVQVRGSVKGKMQFLVTELVVRGENAQVMFEGAMRLAPFALRGDVGFEFKAFDPAMWGISLKNTVRFDLTGKGSIAVDSSGVREAQAEGVFRRLAFGDARFDSLRFAGDLAHGLLRVQVVAGGPSGEIAGSGETRVPGWQGEWTMRFRDLNTGHFPGVPETIGRATGRVDGARYADQRLSIDQFELDLQHWGTRINGSGHFGEEVAGNVQAEVALPQVTGTDMWGTSLTLAGQVDGVVGSDLTVALSGDVAGNAAVDSFRVSARVDSTRVSDMRADLSGAGGVFSAWGQVAFDPQADTDVKWQMDVRDLAVVSEVAGMDLSGVLTLAGDFGGTWAAPSFSAQGSADSLVVAGIPVWDVDINTRWARPDSGAVTLRMDRLTWGGRALQAVFFDAAYARGETSFLLGSGGERRGTGGDGQVADRIFFLGRARIADDNFQVAMDSLHVQVDQVELYNEGPVRFAYSPSRGVQIDQLVLSGPAGRLVARDQRDFQATVEVMLKDLDLRPWAFLAGVSDVGGVLNGEVIFAGTLTDPLVLGEFSLANGKVWDVGFDSATGEMSLGDDRMLVEAKVVSNEGEELHLGGSFPIGETGDIDLRARSEGLALRTLLDLADEKTKLVGIKRSEGMTLGTAVNSVFNADEGISGVLSFDLAARGRFEQPDIRGMIAIKDGAFHMPSLNRAYAPISGRAVVGDGKIQIDSLAFGASATLSGDVTLAGFVPSAWHLSAQFRDFAPVAWRELQLVTDGHLQVTGTPQRTQMTGKLAMKQAEIRLTEFLEMPSVEMDFLETLEIRLQVSAERQVWVRDPTFEVEIEGDVDVIKDRGGLRIYGTMASRRGNYILQNRRLRITRGEIQFQGRPNGNPDMDIRAETRVRAVLTEGEKPEPVNIIVTVGGTLAYPQISFSSEPQLGADMGDIAALLLTGRSVDQFRLSRSGTLDLFLGVASNRLGQVIGQKLNLDLVEVDVGSGNIPRVRLGKYIGDRLFMSYARDISSTAYEVAMEFEVIPGVTLEASQVDEVDEDTKNQRKRESLGVFWKKEW